MNQVDYFRDVFVWAYQRSAARYSAVVQSLGDPDPFHLRYRDEIKELVGLIVRERLDKTKAGKRISDRAKAELEKRDQAKFIEAVETELMSLHDGNIARFRLRPGEYAVWKETWR